RPPSSIPFPYTTLFRSLVELRRRECTLRLAGLRGQFVNHRDNLLDLAVCEFNGSENDLFGLFLGARLNHHDAVLVADNHDVHGRSEEHTSELQSRSDIV